MRYLLDEDVNPGVAEVARGLGLDVTSIHELGRQGLPDEEQLRFATLEGCVFVTRNRDDFVRLVRALFSLGERCAGVLVVPWSLPNRNAPLVAHALRRWHERQEAAGGYAECFVDFLG